MAINAHWKESYFEKAQQILEKESKKHFQQAKICMKIVFSSEKWVSLDNSAK